MGSKNRSKLTGGELQQREKKLPWWRIFSKIARARWVKWLFGVEWFLNLKIGVKLTLGFAVVAIIAGVIGMIGAYNIDRISRAVHELYQTDVAVLGPLHKVSYQLLKLRLNTVLHVLEPKDKFRYEHQVKTMQQSIDNDLTNLKKSNSAVVDQLNSLENAFAAYWKEEAVVLQLSNENKSEEAIAQMNQKLNSLASMIDSIIDSLFTTSDSNAKTVTEANYTQARQTIWLMLIIAGIGIIVAFGLGIVISRIISKPMKQLTAAAEQLATGDVNVNIAAVTAKDETAILTNAFVNMVASIREQAEVVARVAAGDLKAAVNVRSEQDLLAKSLLVEIATLQKLIAETGKLTAAASRGELDVRGDAAQFEGEYRNLITGFNETLDAFTVPLAEAGTVLGKMAVNDFTVAMVGDYQGVLKKFADQINLVQQQLLSLQDLFILVARGDISQLEGYREHGKQSENDQLIPAAITMMEALQNLIGETEVVAEAAARGELAVRGDTGKLNGKYQEIVISINDVLDRMAQPLNEALTVLEAMAQGNLDRTMDGSYQGAYARLQEAINATVQSFNRTLGEINGAADQVASASRELSQGSEAVSQGATAQAATIEELSASVSAIADKIKQNAAQANQTSQLSETTKQSAASGNDRMKALHTAMQQIDEAARGISKIIKVIEEIAFQTNILALNAAIEAARAGQAGKGFAVVAEEVRNLAGRSAAAAKETAELIESSIKKTADGTQIANQTAAALDQMVADVTKAVDLMAGIAAASNEQAAGIIQINQGINQVATVTQNTTATSEESASASEELLGEAENLRQLVGKFRLKESKTVEPAREAAPPHQPEMLPLGDKMGRAGNDFGKY
ncbi:MAG: methyl-accepting chemotaxis protein [Bacillota bacterium]